MQQRRLIPPLALAATLLLWSLPAWAVIRVDFPVSKIYAASKAVVVGTIDRVNAENHVLEARVTDTLKGDAGGDRFRIQVANPPTVFPQVAVSQPVVLFVGEASGKPVAVVHVADTWLLAQGLPGAAVPSWRVVQPYDAARGFPGRTTALVRVIADLKAGKVTLQDELVPEAFRGTVRQLADLKLKPTFLAPLDLTGGGAPALIVGTPDGVRLFLAGPKTYADATAAWGLAPAAASHCAVGDANGDGKPDLLLGPTLWTRRGDKFAATAMLDLPPEAEWLACALADATGDKLPDIVVLLRNGKLIVCQYAKASAETSRELWTGGDAPLAAAFSPDWGDDGQLCVLVVREKDITRYAVGTSGVPPADFQRLTGTPFANYKGFGGKPIEPLIALAIDYDGNGKTDLLIVTDDGGLALANRGMGTFMINDLVHRQFHSTPERRLPFALAAGTCVAPGRPLEGERPRPNLLVLTPDGHLFEMENTER